MAIVSGKQFFGGQPGKPAQQAQSTQQGFLGEAKSRLSDTFSNISSQFKGDGEFAGQSNIRRATGMAAEATGLPFGLAKDALPQFAETGLEKVGEGIGKGLQWIADKTTPQFLVDFVTKYPNAAKDLEDALGTVSNVGQTAGNIVAIGQASNLLSNATRQAVNTTTQTVKGALPNGSGVVEKLAKATHNTPEEIMTRVARITNKEQQAFKNTSGMTVGEYLTKTGNFGAPDEIISKEASKFVQSKNMVDDAFSKLPGEYKVGAIDDGLKLLIKKGSETSTQNVKAPFLLRARELFMKHQTQGLNMSEMNEVKRLLEIHVKLDFKNPLAGDTIKKATYVDKAIRDWQFQKSDYLGFKNIREMNKQTQVSKFLIDKLGDEVVGKGGLNNVGLTDWIVLAGGDPAAVGAFLTKRFFSSKSIQAKIAKMMSGSGTKIVTPVKDLTPQYLQQKALNPGGSDFGKGKYPVQGDHQIGRAPTSYEAQSPKHIK